MLDELWSQIQLMENMWLLQATIANMNITVNKNNESS